MTERQRVDLLLTHAQVLTMDAERRIFADGAVAVDGRDIVAVGQTEELLARYECAETWDLGGALVRPGYIDAHVHVGLQLNRGLIPDDSGYYQAWDDFWVPFLETMTPEEEYLGALLSCIEMVQNGTTTFVEGMSNLNISAVKRAVEKTGMRAVLGEWLWDIQETPHSLRRDTRTCLERLQTQIDEHGLFGPQRVGVAVSLYAVGTASDELLQGAKALSDRYDVMLNIHQSFHKEEITTYMDLIGGQRPLLHLAELGILGPNTTLVHAIWLTKEELDVLVESGSGATHCPAASMKYGLGASRVGSFPEMVQEGVVVALGSDSANWSNVFDIGFQAYLAATIHREARMEYPLITAEDALEMATINGAKVIRQEGILGALAEGHRADIVIDRRKRAEWYPGLDLVYDLVYAGQSKDVDTVIIDGQVILRDGHFVSFDEQAALAEMHQAALSLARRCGHPPTPRWPVIG